MSKFVLQSVTKGDQMAYLKPIKRKNKNSITITYYSHIQSDIFKNGYKYISLQTTDYVTARKRHALIEKKYEKDIKRGIEFEKYDWEDGARGRAVIKNTNLQQLVSDWLYSKRLDCRESTLNRYSISLDAWMKVIGYSRNPKTIRVDDITKYMEICIARGQSNSGINLNLRGIKAFLIWAEYEEHIEKKIKFKMLPEKSRVRYIGEADWKKIMDADVDGFWKDVWTLFRDTGLRRMECAMGKIESGYMVAKPDDVKTEEWKEIKLTHNQLCILQELYKRRDAYKYKIENWINNMFTKQFKKVCKSVGLDYNFHCLRHTFAVITYIKTRNIFEVSKAMYHKDISVTIKSYSQFKIDKIAKDFPSLIEKEDKKAKKVTNNIVTDSYEYINPPR